MEICLQTVFCFVWKDISPIIVKQQHNPPNALYSILTAFFGICQKSSVALP